jgi:uncharacterized protein (DUF2267 family)
MQATHVEALERTIQKTNEWLKAVEEAMQARDRREAYSALRAVLHALRDRLQPDEALQLAAQFPALVRGVYVEGWRLVDKPLRLRSREEFLDAVAEAAGDPLFDAERATRAVFRVLAARVTQGEIEDVEACLPASIRELWPRREAAR